VSENISINFYTSAKILLLATIVKIIRYTVLLCRRSTKTCE